VSDPRFTHHSRARTSAFAARVVLAACIVIGLVALAIFIWYSLRVLLLVFASILVSILLTGLSDELRAKTRLPYAIALLIVVIVITALIGTILWFSAAQLSDQISDLASQLPQSISRLRDSLDQTRIGHLLLSQAPSLDTILHGTRGIAASIGGVVSGTMKVFVSGIVIVVTALFIVSNPRLYLRGALHLVPPAGRERASELFGAIGYTLRWWLIGQSIDMFVIGAAMGVGLWLLNVPLALVLGFLAGMFNFIPNFGPLFSLVPALLLTLPNDPQQALYVLILCITLQSLEGYVLMPLIQGEAVNLPGGLTIVVQLLMSILAGGLGLALAAPLAATALVTVRMLYVRDMLSDPIKSPGDRESKADIRAVKQSTGDILNQ
jgi:predicted PurR-regulated permease PerM